MPLSFSRLLDSLEGTRYLDLPMKRVAKLMHQAISQETKGQRLGHPRLLYAFIIYYTLKRYRSPTPAEVQQELQRVGVSVTVPGMRRAIVRFREQFGTVKNLDWIFEHESGKSNLEMNVLSLGGCYRDVVRGRELARKMKLELAVEGDMRKVLIALKL